VHAVFEGIAIGLESGMVEVFNIIIAIGVHKIAASVAIGIGLARAELRMATVYKLLTIFAAATPFGMILGLAINEAEEPAVSGVFVSLTVGTFLYIAASEVIVEEFAVSRYQWLKFGAFLLGIAIAALLRLLGGHNHSHDDDDDDDDDHDGHDH
jgi:zinc transporter 1/2/3